MSECPNCKLEIGNEEICPQCGFNFNETISCAYLISGNCVHTQEECNIKGLNFEDCNIYLHKSGII